MHLLISWWYLYFNLISPFFEGKLFTPNRVGILFHSHYRLKTFICLWTRYHGMFCCRLSFLALRYYLLLLRSCPFFLPNSLFFSSWMVYGAKNWGVISLLRGSPTQRRISPPADQSGRGLLSVTILWSSCLQCKSWTLSVMAQVCHFVAFLGPFITLRPVMFLHALRIF